MIKKLETVAYIGYIIPNYRRLRILFRHRWNLHENSLNSMLSSEFQQAVEK